MSKKELLNVIELQKAKIERLQVKICKGNHDYVEVKVEEQYSSFDVDYYHYLQCVNCEHKIVKRS